MKTRQLLVLVSLLLIILVVVQHRGFKIHNDATQIKLQLFEMQYPTQDIEYSDEELAERNFN